jgi:RimJ/RimL family protein N-acetyltransferase
MFVHADCRGKSKGVAQGLLGQALKWAKDSRTHEIYLGTTAQFLAAHKFYEKNGFELVEKEGLPVKFPIMVVDSRFYRMIIK